LAKARDIVIIGGSFLGLESACALKRNLSDANVTVVELSPIPLKRAFGEAIGS
jgi:NADPH-dependent 2,4-dienoyl-CoA reductase/sulfur reductase-like enzyme